MKKAVSKRLKVTKNGKVLRRSMGLGHFRSRKNGTQLNRRKKLRNLEVAKSILKQNCN